MRTMWRQMRRLAIIGSKIPTDLVSHTLKPGARKKKKKRKGEQDIRQCKTKFAL